MMCERQQNVCRQWDFISMGEKLAAGDERTFRELGSQFYQDASLDRTL